MPWDDDPADQDASASPQEPIRFTPVDARGRLSSDSPPPADASGDASGNVSFTPINFEDRLRGPAPHSEPRPVAAPPLRPGERYAVGGPAYLYEMPPEELMPELAPEPSFPADSPAPTQPFFGMPASGSAADLRDYQRQYWEHLRQLSGGSPPSDAADGIPSYLARTPDASAQRDFADEASRAAQPPAQEPPPNNIWHTVGWEPPLAHPSSKEPAYVPTDPAHLSADQDDLPKPVAVMQAVHNAQAIPAYLNRTPAEAPASQEPGRRVPPSDAQAEAPAPAEHDRPAKPTHQTKRKPSFTDPDASPARPASPKTKASAQTHDVSSYPPPREDLPHPPRVEPMPAHRAAPTAKPDSASQPPAQAEPRRPVPKPRTTASPRAPIPPQPTYQAPRTPRAPKPPRPKQPLGRVIALWACVAAIAACVVMIGLMLVPLLQSEEGSQPLGQGGNRVALLPQGVTYVPTATPAPTAKPQETPILPINDGALGPIDTPAATYTPAPATRTKPAAYASLVAREEISLLRGEYPELVGWLTMGDLIDAPVAQATNRYYQTHDARRESNANGAVYLDEHFSLRTPPENLLICGANQPEQLGPLQGFRSGGSAFLSKYGVFTLDTLYEEGQYVVFALFDVGVNPSQTNYFNYSGFITFATDAQFASYVKAAKTRSLWAAEIDVQPGDRLVTLAVPNGDTADTRLIVMARRLRDGEDPAALAETLRGARPATAQ